MAKGITIGTDVLQGIAPLLGIGAQPEPQSVAPQGPPPPTPAQAGFQAFSADPQNIQRSQHAVTAPGQPIIPPAPPQFSAPSMPNVQPMQAPDEATNVAGTPPFQSYQEWQGQNPDKLAHPALGKGAGLWGNILQATAAGLSGAAGGLHGDPQAGLDYVQRLSDYDRSIPDVNLSRYNAQVVKPAQAGVQLLDTVSQIGQRDAAAKLAGAKADAVPEQIRLNREKNDKNLAVAGLRRNASGELEEEPNSTFAQARAAHTALQTAQAEVEKSKNDPNSPAYKLAVQKLASARANAAAAATRAQAYMMGQMRQSYNTGLDGQVLPGAPIIQGEGGPVVVGTANASQAVKANSNVAQFNDVYGATNNIENAARALHATGTKLNDPKVVAALTEAKGHGWVSGAAQNWLRGENAASLTPQQRDYVTNVIAYHENLQALRKSAGGGVSDTQVNRLEQMAPGASTPDLDYLLRQTGQIRGTADRLGKGVATAAGGSKLNPNEGNNAGSRTNDAGMIYARDAQGKLHSAKAGTKLPDGWKQVSRGN